MTIDTLPPAPSRQDPDNFAAKADTFVAALPPLVVQINAESAIMLGYAESAEADAATASAKATEAAASELAAANSASEAAASFSEFDSRWLGWYATDPTTNNQGGALVEGVLYYNTGSHLIRIFNGLIWQNALGSTVGEFSIFRQEFTATAGQTTFSLANRFEVGTNNLMVYQAGLRLGNSGYTEVDDHTVTLATPATLGQKVLFEIGVVSSAGATAATMVSLGPVVGMTSTNVQDGITELQTSKANSVDPVFSGTPSFGDAKIGVVSNTGPTIRPTLLLDFANGKRMDSRVVFARSTTATRVNSKGQLELVDINVPRFVHDPITLVCQGLLLEKASTNLLLNSVLAGTNLATQSVTTTAQQYTLSFYGTGTVTMSGAATGTLVGSGDYPTRSSITVTATAGSVTLTVSGSVKYANFEAGTVPTTFIPTAGSTVNRAAETFTMPTNGWYRGDEGTLVTHAAIAELPTANTDLWQLISTDTTSNMSLRYSSAIPGRRYIYNNNSVSQISSNIIATSVNTMYYDAIAYKTNDAAFANNTVVSTDTACNFPSSPVMTSLKLSYGLHKKLAFYPKRLADTTLALITQG